VAKITEILSTYRWVRLSLSAGVFVPLMASEAWKSPYSTELVVAGDF
jgi:hypothetical protein